MILHLSLDVCILAPVCKKNCESLSVYTKVKQLLKTGGVSAEGYLPKTNATELVTKTMGEKNM